MKGVKRVKGVKRGDYSRFLRFAALLEGLEKMAKPQWPVAS